MAIKGKLTHKWTTDLMLSILEKTPNYVIHSIGILKGDAL